MILSDFTVLVITHICVFSIGIVLPQIYKALYD